MSSALSSRRSDSLDELDEVDDADALVLAPDTSVIPVAKMDPEAMVLI